LGGLKYNGRTVIAGFFPEDKFIRRDFGPDIEEERNCALKFQALMQKQLQQQMQQHLRPEDRDFDL